MNEPRNCIDELTEMEQVLKWASENGVRCEPMFHTRNIYTATFGDFIYQAPTLYEALRSAWEKRGGK